MSDARYGEGARSSVRAATRVITQTTRRGSAKMCGLATRKVRVVPQASTAAISAYTGARERSNARNRIATATATQNAVAETSPAQPKVSYARAIMISASHSGEIQGAP